MKLVYILIFFYYEIKQIKAIILSYFKLIKEIKFFKLFNLFNQNTLKIEDFKKSVFINCLKKIRKNYFLKQKQNSNRKSILVDLLLKHHTEYIMINLLIARELQNLTNKPVVCLIYNKDYKTRLIANQFGYEKIIFIKKEKFFERFLYFLKALQLFEKSKNKKIYKNFIISKIEIGKIAFENFYRFNKNLNGKNEVFFKILNLSKSFLYFDFFKNICLKKKVSHLVIGENQFLPHRTLFNLSLKNKIKVFSRLGDAYSGIKIRLFNNYSERYSHKDKYSKKVVGYYIKELLKKKNNLEKLYQKQKKIFDIGKEDVWVKGWIKNESIKTHNPIYKNKNKKLVLILPHVMNDGMFQSEWQLYNTPHEWFEETLKLIKDIKSVNWLIKTHPYEVINTDLKTKNIFFKYIKDCEHVKLLDQNHSLKNYEDKIFCVLTCHGSAGYEYPSIGIPSITTADTRYEHVKCTQSIKSIKEYKYILNNISKIHKVDKLKENRAKIYWYVRRCNSINFDVLPKIKVQGKEPSDYLKKMTAKLSSKKNLGGTFYKYFKLQYKNNNRHTINHKLLKDLKFKNFNIRNDI